MKIVCVADTYINEEMMLNGVKPYLSENDEVKVFFFGQNDKSAMFATVKALEEGKRLEIPVPDGLHEAVKDAEVLIVHLCPVNRDLLEAAPCLKAVMSCRGGMENLDIEAASELGVVVSHNPAHNANAVAEFTIGMILSETRNICRSNFALKNGQWRKDYPNTEITIREMQDLTVGIVGYGSIGRLVAKKLVNFGCRILVADPYATPGSEDYVSFVSMDELLEQSDVVTLHARANGAIMTDREFAKMKDHSYLINSARSYLVDTEAFRKAMDSGKLLGAAIDVFETEPEIPQFYRDYDNITITNHRGGNTINSYKDAPVFAIKNYLGFKNGEQLKFWANRNQIKNQR